MGPSGAAHGWGWAKSPSPLSEICHTYPTMMRLGAVVPYLKKIQKIYKSCDTPHEFCRHQHLSATFVITRNTGIDCILIHSFRFF